MIKHHITSPWARLTASTLNVSTNALSLVIKEYQPQQVLKASLLVPLGITTDQTVFMPITSSQLAKCKAAGKKSVSSPVRKLTNIPIYALVTFCIINMYA